MSEHVERGIFSSTAKGDVAVDPGDPRTWWQHEYAQKGSWIQTSMQGPDHVMALSGLPAEVFHFDPVAHVRAVAAVMAYYKIDAALVSEDVYNFEAEALGQKMIYGHAMPTIDFREPLLASHADLAKLKVPSNWLERGRVRYYFEVSRLMNEMGTSNAIFCAPFSLAVGLRSYPKLIRDMKRDPAFVHDLFTCLVDEILPSYLKAAADYTGIKNWSGADAWAAYPNLTPELIEEWVVPYANRLLANTMKLGFAAMPIAGGDYCEEDLSKFDADILWKTLDAQSHIIAGMPLFVLAMGRWQDYPMEPVVEYLQQFKQQGIPATIICSVNARVMRDGPQELIIKTARRFIETLARDFNVSAVGAASTPADTPSRHVHALVATVHTYGMLPLAENFDAVPFEPPERESFQEYVAKMTNGQGLQF